MRHIFFSVLLVALSPSVFANNFLDISVLNSKFNYQEYSTNDTKLNTETGFLPGVLARYGYTYENLGINLMIEYHNGNANYQGISQTGAALHSTTDEQLIDLGVEPLWYPFSPGLGVYTKFQWIEWQRHIQPTNQTISLHETYQWQNIEAGIISPILENGKQSLELKLGVSHSNNGQVAVNLTSLGYGKPIVDLGDGTGFSITLNYNLELKNANKIILGLVHKQWAFSRGIGQSISNNNSAITITEPKSDTKITSIFLSYRFNTNKLLG